jgi:hypothetical protein
MTTITFDTLKFANKLKAAGVSDKQAEAEAEVLAEALEVNMKELATKADLNIAVKEIEYKIELLRAETKQAIAESKNQLIRWMGGFAVIGASYVTWLFEFHGKV